MTTLSRSRASVLRSKFAQAFRRLAWTLIRRTVAWQANAVLPARLAVGAILRNEGPYLLEWVAWHRCLGIKDFYLADNISTDGTTELLKGLNDIGVVTRIDFPGDPARPAQLPAYAHIAATYGHLVDWIAFIDGDEFIQPLTLLDQPGQSIQSWLALLPAGVGAVAMNWVIYGSSGRDDPGTGPVVERFTLRGPQDMPENNHIKSIVRMSAWAGLPRSPHGFAIKRGRFYVDTDLALLQTHEHYVGRMAKAIWGAFRLNHYVLKSKAEFLHKKLPRGRPDSFIQPVRALSYFYENDINEVNDPVDPAFLRQVKTEMEALRTRLGTLAPHIRDLDLAPILANEYLD